MLSCRRFGWHKNCEEPQISKLERFELCSPRQCVCGMRATLFWILLPEGTGLFEYPLLWRIDKVFKTAFLNSLQHLLSISHFPSPKYVWFWTFGIEKNGQKNWKSASALRSHMLTHINEKPYKCEFCVRAFRQRSHLTEHMRVHNADKSFKCTQCDRAFAQRSPLVAHMRIHMGEKPFICKYCGKNFTHYSSYTRHEKNHENYRTKWRKWSLIMQNWVSARTNYATKEHVMWDGMWLRFSKRIVRINYVSCIFLLLIFKSVIGFCCGCSYWFDPSTALQVSIRLRKTLLCSSIPPVPFLFQFLLTAYDAAIHC